MAAGGSGGGGVGGKDKYKDAKDAKHLLDQIGETIQKQAHAAALKRGRGLQGFWSLATYPNDRNSTNTTPSNPCKLLYQYHTNVTSTVIDPCANRQTVRFSDTKGAECDYRKIRGSDKTSNGGACAAYRRLHLCDKNLEQIEPHKITTHNLLVDVCQAAKFEGQSITRDYPKYRATYVDSPSEMCTMLARSFADIGDIVRGKDLYLGNNKKDKLQIKLKEYFKKIYDDLVQNKEDAETHYEGDDNYYQLREDWWALNRKDVWKALTCEAYGTYFRKTCSDDKTETDKKCQCVNRGDVPTYFDYVPQYLRWFEEWSEDFCTKRKHKLENAIEKCRKGEDQNGKERYCDFNGYDCKGTASGKHKYLWDYKCAGCLFSCSDFRKWIAKQKDEFEKQKNKYTDEINGTSRSNGGGRQKRSASTNKYDGYDKKFYDILKIDYQNVETFLEKLSKEGICQSQPTVGNETADNVDFTNEKYVKTFSHTEYCEPCPWCGIEEQKDGKWKRINDHSACKEEELYTPKENAKYTKINVLTSGEGHEDIAKRLKEFCTKTQNGGGGSDDCGGNSDPSLCEPWQCYQPDQLEKVGGGEVDDKLKGAGGLCIFEKMKGEKKVKKQKTFNNFFNFWVVHMLKDSIDWRNKLNSCINNGKTIRCKNGCKTPCKCYESWIQQKKTEWEQLEKHYEKQNFGEGISPYMTLELNLQDDYFPSIKKAYPGVKFVGEIKKIIDGNQEIISSVTKDDNSITKFLQQEKEIATECKDCPLPEDKSRAHSDTPTPGGPQPRPASEEPDAEEDEEEEEEEEEEVCGMVKALLDKSNGGTSGINDCNPKDHPNKDSYPKWNCDTSKIKSEHSGACMPPRRIKLCVNNLQKLSDQTSPEELRKAFIECAAIETFWLWHKYKDDKKNEKTTEGGGISDDPDDPQKKLEGGTIPEDFKRQMFYTFGDYRDLCLGKDIGNDSGKDISGTVTSILSTKNGETQTTADKWWDLNGEDIWKGMLCALEKDGGSSSIKSTYSYKTVTFTSTRDAPTLTEFSEKHQFLRWFTEWGEEFCRTRGVKIKELEKGCEGYVCNGDNGDKKNKCNDACQKYKKFIEDWREYYNKQKGKFLTLNPKPEYARVDDLELSKSAREYLDKQLKKFCENKSGYCEYKCMENASRQKKTKESTEVDMPASLDYPPEGYTNKCDCKDEKEVKPEGAPAIRTIPQIQVDVCNTVKNALISGKLDEACTLKYGQNAPTSWKCVTPSGDKAATSGKDGATGGLCIPPRRRRLYVGHLQKWATTSVTQPQDGTPSQPDPLLKAFVESAAIETFFLWDRYKKEWMAQKLAEQGQNGLLAPSVLPVVSPVAASTTVGAGGLTTLNGGSGGDENDKDPQEELKQGTIPDEFLRQMFYTLADYKDILFSNTDIVLKALSSSEKEKMKEIQQKITDMLNKTNSGSTPPHTPGPPNSVQQRENLWSKYAEPIWNGMIYALTYKEDTSSGDKPTQDPTVRTKLWDSGKKKPTDNYQYSSVTLKEEEETSGVKPQTTLAPSGEKTTLNNPKLTEFVEIPTYFRYLHEWGQNFCKERKKRLEKIEKECKVDKGDGGRCSGDGESCETVRTQDYDILPSFNCPGCGRECRKYKKWIKTKRTEFEEQENAFTKQKDNYVKESKGAGRHNDNNVFRETLNTCSKPADFLNRLGSCKKDNGNSNIPFDDKDKSFGHEKYCKPCPKFKVNCKNGHCGGSPNGNTCKNETITAQNFKDKIDCKDVFMRVSDNSITGFAGDLEACGSAGIFTGIIEKKWKCGKVCGVDICEQTNVNKKQNDKEYIQIRALLKRWVENFLEDYNKIKKKLKSCINNGEKSICIKDCVGKWVEIKKEEWKTIRDRYVKQYKNEDDDNYKVKHFLEGLLSQNEVKKATGRKNISDFESKVCNCPENSKQKDEKKDIIDCLLDKLQNEITSCPTPTSGQTCTQSTSQQTLDLDDQIDEDPENKVAYPKICGDMGPTQQQDEGEEDCKPSDTIQEVKDEKTKAEEDSGTVVTPEESSNPSPAPSSGDDNPETPQPQPPPPPPLPPLKTALVTSTLAWSVGIGFATFTYFFLKKKTKASVGNLFQILQIPKSDYDIPTLKSSNRYIPYASDRYKGKTYIYMEGDSSGDEKYAFMSDTTDVTSSESEYEELDVNDIYVPGSPKYKTLIEVVLEPSGKNTTASGKNTPSDTQNDIPTSDTPPPITDNEWNTLKDDFISQYLQSEQPNDIPNDYTSGNSSTNTNITTTSRHNVEEKPFITSIHDRNLLNGEEYNYDMSNNSGIYPSSSNRDSLSGTKVPYSGIDLINDTLSGNAHIDIYDELLKRKENELFGTNHVKQTSIHSVAKLTNSDPIHNQLELFHKWLDRHRDMCEKWENHHERLAKLKEEWENETHSGNTHPSESNKTLNTDVSIQIHMDNPKPINEFTNMDTILEDLDKPFNEPYYDVQDDIYYDVHDHDASTVDSNAMDVPSKVQIEMDVNTKLVKEKYPIADVWDI